MNFSRFKRKRCDRCGELRGLLTPELHKCKSKKKPMDPEKRRKLMMWAYAISMVAFLALTIISASLFARGFNNLLEINNLTVESLAEAENMTFPLNETRTATAIAIHAFFAPVTMFTIMVGLVFALWFGTWTLRMTGEFLRVSKRRPSEEELNKFLEDMYVRKKKRQAARARA